MIKSILKKALLSAGMLLFINSCTLVGYGVGHFALDKTHKDIMDTYTTKEQVVSSFGIPSQKETLEGIEVWRYDLGETTVSTARVGTNSSRSAISGVGNSSTYSKYVEFQFRGDNVSKWRSGGVNYRKYFWENILTTAGLLIDTGLVLLFAEF